MSAGDALEGLSSLHADGGVEGLAGGLRGVEEEFVDQAEGVLPEHLEGDAAGGFPPEAGKVGGEDDEVWPYHIKLGFVFVGVHKDHEFVHKVILYRL